MVDKNLTEVNIELAGNIYKMQPSFQALCAIESAINKPLYNLLNDFDSKGILLSEQVKIIYHAVKAGGNILSEDKIGEIICQQGIGNSVKIILLFLQKIIGVASAEKASK